MRRAWLLALLAGGATVFAFAPFGLFPLAFLGLGVLVWLLAGAARARAGFALGFAWGFGAFAAGVSWLYVALERYGGVPAPVAALAIALFCAYLALYPALAGAAFAALRGRGVAHAPVRAAALFGCALAGLRMAARRALHRLPLARHRLCADAAQPARRPAAGSRRVWRRGAERLRRRAVRSSRCGRAARAPCSPGARRWRCARPSLPASRCSATPGPSRPVRR
jgi:signal transduction histidine kinase